MAYRVTKTYGHDLGLSACFRQPKATSHCRFLHGYALSFKFTFEADTLDENNWVIDFGSLKPLKQWLVDTFDHRLLVAQDDPEIGRLLNLATPTIDELADGQAERVGIADVLVVPAIGCEAFATMAAISANGLLAGMRERGKARGVRLVEVEVREHGANSAIWVADK